MSEASITAKAYAKILFHAAKYPYLAVNGLLLAEKNTKSKYPTIVDSIPLFHQCLYVTPMAEIALIQVEAKAAEEDLQIVGYYAAAENFYENNLDRVPGLRIAEKIAELNPSAYLAMLDNRALTMNMQYPALKLWQNNDSKWQKVKYVLHDQDRTIEAVSLLLQQGAMKQIVDFDNYLDDPQTDWTNLGLIKDLEKILAMDNDDE